jgi:hypothetical protein
MWLALQIQAETKKSHELGPGYDERQGLLFVEARVPESACNAWHGKAVEGVLLERQ